MERLADVIERLADGRRTEFKNWRMCQVGGAVK